MWLCGEKVERVGRGIAVRRGMEVCSEGENEREVGLEGEE